MRTAIFLLLCSFANLALAADYNGAWEIQSLGADRNLVVKHKGDKITIKRVMWPEWQGEKYKLEHLYRGKITGEDIRGQLLVREEGSKKWELLRDFNGQVKAQGLVIDGLPIKRASESATPTISESKTVEVDMDQETAGNTIPQGL